MREASEVVNEDIEEEAGTEVILPKLIIKTILTIKNKERSTTRKEAQ